MTHEEMRVALRQEELDYEALARQLEASDIPLLRSFSISGDPMLSTKAVYLASLLDADSAIDIVDVAARSQDQLVRIAAASALPNIPNDRRNQLALRLIDDRSPQVVKLTLGAIDNPDAILQQRLGDIAESSRFDHLRSLARERMQPQN